MWPRSLLSVAAAFAVCVNGDATTTAASTRTTATTATASPTHTIAVGASGFKYSPNQITNASVGDVIEFRFYPGGHTVARSDFGQPCIPYELSGINRVGFFSGQISPQVVTNDLPTYQVRVNDTDPIFFYCTAPGSCFQQHMIGVINPSANETLDLQMQFALNATYQLAPGEPFPSESVSPTHTPSATSSPSNTATAAANSGGDGGHGLSAGAIAGIAIGGAAVLVLAGTLIFLCGRKGGLDRAYRRSTQTFPPPMTDNKYNPKSPGQETFSTNHFSMAMPNDPYHTGSPHAYSSSPPPMDPNGHPAYGTYSSSGGHSTSHSPLMGQTTGGSQGYYPGATPPPADVQAHRQHMQGAPVELPASNDPGNSPLPDYKAGRQYSWSQGQETQYRPGSKT